MTLILLAISATIVLAVLAWNLALYALPVMVATTAFQWMYGADIGFWTALLVSLGAALMSFMLVFAIIGFARNPALRLAALALVAVPSAIAGYALAYGVAKDAIDSVLLLNLLGGISGIVVATAALFNLGAVAAAISSR
ncbi:hypothetical protein NO932_16530 [Pelagibacterium sp. 26DY04]|uniref:hypothetical protein n=1 Tax=Pelagibacterium sp. 26DY04 TaxID=2967130 RepID=UPI0028153031|nr:hypothetical protein [Pelagibacterium sp. 26DY04]WMT86498.1 hypothetical protein NO932_16530 [Pelagibacterium sp. 26DY04]